MIVTTTSNVEGMRITEYKGVVSATAIHGIHIGKDFMAAGRNLVGGRSKTYESELDQGQSEALGGAGNMLMVNMTGTAVVVSIV